MLTTKLNNYNFTNLKTVSMDKQAKKNIKFLGEEATSKNDSTNLESGVEQVSALNKTLIKKNEEKELRHTIRQLTDPNITEQLKNLYLTGKSSSPEVLELKNKLDDPKYQKKLLLEFKKITEKEGKKAKSIDTTESQAKLNNLNFADTYFNFALERLNKNLSFKGGKELISQAA